MRPRRGPLHELQLDGCSWHVADGHQGAGGVGRRAGPALWCGQYGRHQVGGVRQGAVDVAELPVDPDPPMPGVCLFSAIPL